MKPEVPTEQKVKDIFEAMVLLYQMEVVRPVLDKPIGPELSMDFQMAADFIRARLTEYDALKRMLQDPDLQDVLNLREERDTLKASFAQVKDELDLEPNEFLPEFREQQRHLQKACEQLAEKDGKIITLRDEVEAQKNNIKLLEDVNFEKRQGIYWFKQFEELLTKFQKWIDEAQDQRVRAEKAEAEVEKLRLQLKYPDPEDMPGELAAKFCPFKDPLHFHHDGCPSEWAVEERAKKAESALALAKTVLDLRNIKWSDGSESCPYCSGVLVEKQHEEEHPQVVSGEDYFSLRDAYRAAVQNATKGVK